LTADTSPLLLVVPIIISLHYRVQNNPRFFLKKPNPVGFLDQQEKIGKIIQKLSNLKP